MVQQIRFDGSDPRSSTSSDSHKGRVVYLFRENNKPLMQALNRNANKLYWNLFSNI
jgi:hypothetical protein